MKALRLSLAAILLLTACGANGEAGHDHAEPHEHDHAEPHEEAAAEAEGVTFREGKGLEVSPETKRILNISISEVTEGSLSSSVTRTGHVYRHDQGSEIAPASSSGAKPPVARVSLVVPAEDARGVSAGGKVKVGNSQGTVTEVKALRSGPVSDAEVLVEFADPDGRYRVGNPVAVTIEGSPADASAVIPQSALLRTVNGTFVYVPNGKYYFRTAVAVGRKTDQVVEVVDGLYAGDQVVTEGVTSLWLAELQAIRGGVGCAHGH